MGGFRDLAKVIKGSRLDANRWIHISDSVFSEVQITVGKRHNDGGSSHQGAHKPGRNAKCKMDPEENPTNFQHVNTDARCMGLTACD